MRAVLRARRPELIQLQRSTCLFLHAGSKKCARFWARAGQESATKYVAGKHGCTGGDIVVFLFVVERVFCFCFFSSACGFSPAIQ